MNQGTWVLVGALALAIAFGGWRRLRDGGFHGRRPSSTDREPDATAVLDTLGHELGERATLLQFSSAFCAPCRATRRVLGDVAAVVPGVAHIEIDAEQHLDLVRRLSIFRTPTTLVLDARGREHSRAAGAPSRHQVLATLSQVLES